MKYLFSLIALSFVLTSCPSGEKTEEEANNKEEQPIIDSSSVSPEEDKEERKSPRQEAKGMIGDAEIIIKYGSPRVRERKVWGEIVKYDKIWRTGADESTTFETNQNLKIADKALPLGIYSFFTIPKEDGNWTVVFNSQLDLWGAYDYDESKDVLKVEAKATMTENFKEEMTFEVKPDGILLSWEKLELFLPIKSDS